jgi:hypothetical protein
MPALIVSFLGGIHWGVAMREARAAACAVHLGRAAVAAGLGGGDDAAQRRLVIHGVMLLVCYAGRPPVYPQHGLAGWLTLRFRLSAVAALSCFLGAAGT